MFKINKVIPNIDVFIVDVRLNIVLRGLDKNLLINNETKINNIVDDLIISNDNLYFNNSWTIIIFNFITKQIKYINDKNILNINNECSENLILVDKNEKLFLFNKLNEEETSLNIVDFDWGKIYLSQDNLYLENKKRIENYKLIDSKKLWQLALCQLGKFQTEFAGEKSYEVKQFVGVYKDVLWVFLNSQEFIGLDINSGEIIHWLKGVKKENISGEIDEYLDEKDIYVFFDTNYLIDTKAKKIIGLKADRYYEIDLDSEFIEPKMFGLWTKMQNVGINKNDISSRNILVDNNLYFYNHNDLKFAIFDIDTKEIIYVSDKLTQDETKRREIKDFQVANDNVYVLDSTGDLYIFEKEK